MIPVVAFFVISKLADFYTATAVFMASLVLLAAYYWIKDRKLPKGHVAAAVLGLMLGGATLYYHNVTFLQYKLTIVNWAFAVALLVSQFIGDKVLVQRAAEAALTLPEQLWRKINLAWTLFFFAVGALNIYVMNHMSEDAWVNFKFALIPLNFVFTLLHIPFIARYLPQEK